MSIKSVASVALLSALAVPAFAGEETFSYTGVDASVAAVRDSSIAEKTVNGKGLSVEGSYGFAGTPFFVAAGAETSKTDSFDSAELGNVEVRDTEYTLKAGMHLPVYHNTDFVWSYEYYRDHGKISGDVSETEKVSGHTLNFGVRSMVVKDVEVHANVAHVYTPGGGNNGDVTNDLTLGGLYYFTKEMAAGVSLLDGDGYKGVSVDYKLNL